MNKQQQYKTLIVFLIMTALLVIMELVFMIPAVDNFFIGWLNSDSQWILWICLWVLMFLQTNLLQIPAVMVLQVSQNAGFNITGWQYILVVMSAYMLGVIVTYWLGRKFGSKAVKWIAGDDEEFKKWSSFVNQKGKLWYLLTVLFPLFPDDLLCIVAGSLKFDFGYFCFANLYGRTIGLITMVWVLVLAKNIFSSNFPTMLVVWLLALIAELIYFVIIRKKMRKEKNMKHLTVENLKKMWVEFYKKTGHVQIDDASLIPQNDGSVLFTTAGMHPLVPYLLGAKHPSGNKLCDIQRCVRTNDIDEVGDNRHCTFFEMLGYWSLGDYFKETAIKNSYEFLTSEKYLGIPVEKLAVTVFEGNENAPRDEESYDIWKNCGMPEDHIFYEPKENNWWAAGSTGPCGPDTEMFYITDKEPCCETCSPACDCGRYIEIWNNVFMQYVVEKDGDKPKLLEQKNVDSGMGAERTVTVLNGYDSVFEIECFKGAIELVEKSAEHKYKENEETLRAYRIIADHMRSSVFIMGDENGISPSNVGQGYVLRRLIRRSLNSTKKIGAPKEVLIDVAKYYIDYFKDYPILSTRREFVLTELEKEINKFSNTINGGLKEINKLISHLETKVIDGKSAFRLYDTFGFPIELTQEIAKEKGYEVDMEGYKVAYQEHQQKSRMAGEQVFKGGLSSTSYEDTKYHTLAHIMLASLREMFGPTVLQRGCNITPERIRFDFSLDHKMTDEEKQILSDKVNARIKQGANVIKEEMSLEDARKNGAMGIFDNKYGERVSVYTIGDFSKEICGGPHVQNTSELGEFILQKEESSSAGVRRIKGILK